MNWDVALPTIVWVITTLVTLQALFIAVGVVMEKRQPAAKLAWLLVLVLVPLLGLVLYLLLGRLRPRIRRRAKRESNREWRAYQHLDTIGVVPSRERISQVDPALRAVVELTRHNSGAALSFDNSVDILSTGFSKFTALEAAIEQAREYICLQYYVFSSDETGQSVRESLVAAAKRGVRVRILLDGAGTFWMPKSFYQPLRDAGADVAFFLPVKFPFLTQRRDFRNHRKLVVIDGREALLGGMNIGNEYLGDPPGTGCWRDTHAHVTGPCVMDLLQVFMEDWFHATHEHLILPNYEPDPQPAGHDVVQVVSSGPDRRWPTFQQVAFTVIANATESVLLTTPYFVPDASIVMALETRALAGVDVRVLVPARPNQPLLRAANRSYYGDLLEAGVRVFEYLPTMIHTKTLIVDGRYSLIGSANMDNRSFRLNFELGLSVIGQECAERLTHDYYNDQANSRERTLEGVRRRSRAVRFGYALVQLASPLL